MSERRKYCFLNATTGKIRANVIPASPTQIRKHKFQLPDGLIPIGLQKVSLLGTRFISDESLWVITHLNKDIKRIKITEHKRDKARAYIILQVTKALTKDHTDNPLNPPIRKNGFRQ